MLQDATFWVLLSFIIFCFGFYRFGWPTVTAMLDGKIERIRKELHDAEALRLEAQDLLVQYQRKHRDAMQEAEDIAANARAQAETMRAKMEADLADMMARREKQLAERLARLEQEAQAEIKAAATRLALQAAENIIRQSLDAKGQAALVDKTIADLSKTLN